MSSTHQMTSQENTLLGIFQQAIIMLEVTVISHKKISQEKFQQ